MAELPAGLPNSVRIGSTDHPIVAWSFVDAQDRGSHGEFSVNGREIRVNFLAAPDRKSVV